MRDDLRLAIKDSATGYFVYETGALVGEDLASALVACGLAFDGMPSVCYGVCVAVEGRGVSRHVGDHAEESAFKSAATEAVWTGLDALVGDAVCRVGENTLCSATAVVRKARGFDGLVEGRLVALEKDAMDPTTPEGFLFAVQSFAGQLGRIMGPVDASNVNRMLDAVAGDGWMSDPRKRDATLRALAKVLPDKDILKAVAPSLRLQLEGTARGVMGESRTSAIAAHAMTIDSMLTLRDEASVKRIAGSAYNFVRDSFGHRNEAMSVLARSIVAQGLSDGLGPYDIAGMLDSGLRSSYEARTRNYHVTVAMSMAGRARSRGLMNSFDDAGFESARVVAVLDEATSEVCRAMDGRLISVKGAVAQNDLAEAEAMKAPESIKYTMPWLREERTETGRRIVAPGRGGALTEIATLGQGGRWSVGLSADKLPASGVGFPPYHAHCRTTTIPEYTSSSFGTSEYQRPTSLEPSNRPAVLEPQQVTSVLEPRKPTARRRKPDIDKPVVVRQLKPIPTGEAIPNMDRESMLKKVRAIEDDIVRSKTEKMRIIDSSGNVVASKTGAKDHVIIDAEMVKTAKGAIVTHNHPAGESFSMSDVGFMLRNDVREIRAVTTRYRYSIMPPANAGDPAELLKKATTLRNKYMREEAVNVVGSVRSGDMTKEDAIDIMSHRVWERIAEKTGLVYEREKM